MKLTQNATIEKLIQAHLTAIDANNTQQVKNAWAQAPYAVSLGGGEQRTGWAELEVWFEDDCHACKQVEALDKKRSKRKNKVGPPTTAVKGSFKIYQDVNVAFVFYDEQYDYIMHGKTYKGKKRMFKIVENVSKDPKKEEWKIIGVFVP